MKDNPYSPLTEEELKKQEAENKERQARLNEIIQSGKRCLATEDFAQYKKKYIEFREATIKAMYENNDPDPVRFAFFCKGCLAQLNTASLLIDLVEHDANRKL